MPQEKKLDYISETADWRVASVSTPQNHTEGAGETPDLN
jgi:hypothetical protein